MNHASFRYVLHGKCKTGNFLSYMAKGWHSKKGKLLRKMSVWKTGFTGTKARIILKIVAAILIIDSVQGTVLETHNLPVKNYSVYCSTVTTVNSNWQCK